MKKMKKMNNELIKKGTLISTLKNWVPEQAETSYGDGYKAAIEDIIKLIKTEKPVKGLELPYLPGETVYVIDHGEVHKRRVTHYKVRGCHDGTMDICIGLNNLDDAFYVYSVDQAKNGFFKKRGIAERTLKKRQKEMEEILKRYEKKWKRF